MATVTVMISVPLGEVARNGVLSLRAALDGDEDNDVTDSRPVAFSVGSVAAAAPVPRPARFPWWMLVAGAAVVLVVGGLTALTVWSGRHPPPPPAQEEDLTGLVSTQQKIEYLERRKGEIGALTVTVDPSSCIVRGDWIRRKASAPGEGDKATISAGVGSKVDGDCPRAEPRGEIHPKLQAYRTWAARNPDIYASIQPFTIEEIIEFLERRFNEIGSLKLHYDENVCYGLDKVEPEVRDDGTIASDSTGKQIYVALIGTRLDSPCQSDDPRNERRQKIRDLSRWADSRDITTLDRPE
ncbi:hypothetical protein [Ensifer sp. CCNWLW38]|uniref:hypothetical protein n=1 Tax=Ensifer sp. CCNWLW38 TaxID=3122071 RepID=UPI00300F9ED6